MTVSTNENEWIEGQPPLDLRQPWIVRTASGRVVQALVYPDHPTDFVDVTALAHGENTQYLTDIVAYRPPTKKERDSIVKKLMKIVFDK